MDERDAESAEELFAIRKQKAKELQHRIALREERLKVKAIRIAQAKRKAMTSLTGTTQGVGGFFKTSLRRDLGLNAFASVCQRYKKSH